MKKFVLPLFALAALSMTLSSVRALDGCGWGHHRSDGHCCKDGKHWDSNTGSCEWEWDR